MIQHDNRQVIMQIIEMLLVVFLIITVSILLGR